MRYHIYSSRGTISYSTLLPISAVTHMSRLKSSAKKVPHLIKRLSISGSEMPVSCSLIKSAHSFRAWNIIPTLHSKVSATTKNMKKYEYFIKSKNLIVVRFFCDVLHHADIYKQTHIPTYAYFCKAKQNRVRLLSKYYQSSLARIKIMAISIVRLFPN